MMQPHVGRHPEIPCTKCDRGIINDDTCRGQPHSSAPCHATMASFHFARLKARLGVSPEGPWETSSQPVLALLTAESHRPLSLTFVSCGLITTGTIT